MKTPEQKITDQIKGYERRTEVAQEQLARLKVAQRPRAWRQSTLSGSKAPPR